jgi:hypothetical protein
MHSPGTDQFVVSIAIDPIAEGDQQAAPFVDIAFQLFDDRRRQAGDIGQQHDRVDFQFGGGNLRERYRVERDHPLLAPIAGRGFCFGVGGAFGRFTALPLIEHERGAKEK